MPIPPGPCPSFPRRSLLSLAHNAYGTIHSGLTTPNSPSPQTMVSLRAPFLGGAWWLWLMNCVMIIGSLQIITLRLSVRGLAGNASHRGDSFQSSRAIATPAAPSPSSCYKASLVATRFHSRPCPSDPPLLTLILFRGCWVALQEEEEVGEAELPGIYGPERRPSETRR